MRRSRRGKQPKPQGRCGTPTGGAWNLRAAGWWDWSRHNGAIVPRPFRGSKRLAVIAELIAQVFQADGRAVAQQLFGLGQVPAAARAFADDGDNLEPDVRRSQSQAI